MRACRPKDVKRRAPTWGREREIWLLFLYVFSLPGPVLCKLGQPGVLFVLPEVLTPVLGPSFVLFLPAFSFQVLFKAQSETQRCSEVRITWDESQSSTFIYITLSKLTGSSFLIYKTEVYIVWIFKILFYFYCNSSQLSRYNHCFLVPMFLFPFSSLCWKLVHPSHITNFRSDLFMSNQATNSYGKKHVFIILCLTLLIMERGRMFP